MLFAVGLSAQETYMSNPIKESNSEIGDVLAITALDEMPKYPTGEEAMMKFIYESIKYPKAAKDLNLSGTCVVSFIVEKDGSISNAKIVRDVGGGCGEEVLRIVDQMPKWIPGKKNGEIVRAIFNLPIKFILQKPKQSKRKKKNRKK